jgi:hypothetical protein
VGSIARRQQPHLLQRAARLLRRAAAFTPRISRGPSAYTVDTRNLVMTCTSPILFCTPGTRACTAYHMLRRPWQKFMRSSLNDSSSGHACEPIGKCKSFCKQPVNHGLWSPAACS